MDILPLEIRRKIFRYLKQTDLQRCYSVCKSWYLIAIPLNWEEVSLNGIQIDLVKSHLQEPDHSEYFKYGHLITKLSIRDSYYSFHENRHEFSKSELLVLLDQFPNLEEIDFNASGHFKEYLKFLLDTKTYHLKKITARLILLSDETHLHNLLFLVYYKLRESITSMDLLYDKSTVTFGSEQINVLDSLAQFKQLTELVFCNKYDINLTPFQLRKMCPNLKLLRFISDYPISDSAMLHLLENSSRIDLNFIANLTNLGFHIPSLSPAYTKYLADHLPNQLTVLDIAIRAQNMFDWIDLVGIELVSRFMEKTCKVNAVSIKFNRGDRHGVRKGDETKATTFFRLLNAFRRTPQTYCEATFSSNSCYEKEIGHSLRYCRDGILHFSYDLNVDPRFFKNLPDKTRSMIGPEVFNRLTINMENMSSSAVKPILTYSFLNCPNIQNFYLLCGEDLSGGGGGFHVRYNHKEDLISSDRHDINYLEIGYIRPTQSYFNLVSTYLHNIETISLQIENLGSLDDGSVIDFTVFKKLKTFTVQIGYNYGNYVENDYDDVVLITYTNGEKDYYDLDEGEYYKPYNDYTDPRLTLICDKTVSFVFDYD